MRDGRVVLSAERTSLPLEEERACKIVIFLLMIESMAFLSNETIKTSNPNKWKSESAFVDFSNLILFSGWLKTPSKRKIWPWKRKSWTRVGLGHLSHSSLFWCMNFYTCVCTHRNIKIKYLNVVHVVRLMQMQDGGWACCEKCLKRKGPLWTVNAPRQK